MRYIIDTHLFVFYLENKKSINKRRHGCKTSLERYMIPLKIEMNFLNLQSCVLNYQT